METIVDIIGLAAKTDTALTVEMLVEIPIVSKIDVSKTIVSKTDISNIVEEGRVYNLVDEVEVTSVNVVLSWTSANIYWMLVLMVLVTTNPAKVVSMIDVVNIFLGE